MNINTVFLVGNLARKSGPLWARNSLWKPFNS